VLDENVPFQFDKASNFNAATNASGKLTFLARGKTAAETLRKYHVYFDTTGSFTAPSFTPQVTTDGQSSDQGKSAIKVTTLNATYYLQYANGGFSSIVDKDGHDWIGFNPDSGSQSSGEYRGIPNMVFPGGGFHPGFDTATTTIVNSGPLKTTIEVSAQIDKGNGPVPYKLRYEIFGTFVRTTVIDAGASYWFLYEGTPGGELDNDDSVVRSDGQVTGINDSWLDSDGLGTSNGEEWLYFRDNADDRYIYFVHNTTDNIVDSYHPQNDGGQGAMTVFGFGRDDGAAQRDRMTGANNVFTFGINDGGGNFGAASSDINGTYRDVACTPGKTQHLT